MCCGKKILTNETITAPGCITMGKRIVILFHENEPSQRPRYVISFLADIWRADGNEVVFLFGVRKFVPADLIIVHVDLSVVPDEYLEFARQYPIVLNGAVKDIRKSTFSKNLVGADDPYQGKVIVKSDLNYAGKPEQHLNASTRSSTSLLCKIFSLFSSGLPGRTFSFKSSRDYRVYDHLHLVPQACFENPGLVVEKFLPEQEKGLYFVRNYQFLGDRMTCTRLGSKNPIVKWKTMVSNEPIEPHPEIIHLQKEMNFDYGKFDYVVHEGKAILLDINKTTGAIPRNMTPELERMRRYRAEGISWYFR